MKYIIIILTFIFVSCSSKIDKQQVFIRDTVYSIVPQIIRINDTVRIFNDTLISYLKMNYNQTDTLVYVKYYPVNKNINILVKPDTVKFFARDTLYNTEIKEKIIETPFLSKVGLVLTGFILPLIIVFLYYLFIKIKEEFK